MAMTQVDQRAFWQGHFENYRASGLSRPAYCREHGLKAHQFIYQLKQSKRNVPKVDDPKGKTSGFAAVVVSTPKATSLAAQNSAARLVISEGASLEFSSAMDPRWVARFIAELGVIN